MRAKFCTRQAMIYFAWSTQPPSNLYNCAKHPTFIKSTPKKQLMLTFFIFLRHDNLSVISLLLFFPSLFIDQDVPGLIPSIIHNFQKFFFLQVLRICFYFQKGQMLKAPLLKSSGLHISVFQDRSERGEFNKIFKKVLK